MKHSVFAIAVFSATACSGQAERFRYTLQHGPHPSTFAASDSIHSCPSRADTLWTNEFANPIPLHWLDASLRLGCNYTHLPLSVRRRLRDDPASLEFYANVVGDEGAPEHKRAWALQQLSWSGEHRHLPLFIAAAQSGKPGILPNGEYNLSYRAINALASFIQRSRQARGLVWAAATNTNSEHARNAGAEALSTANTPWSRNMLRKLDLSKLDAYTRSRVDNALAHPPCRPGTIFAHWFGIEGQNYSKCEPPPDFR